MSDLISDFLTGLLLAAIAAAAIVLATGCSAAESSDLRPTLEYLSSDELGGRVAGSEGMEKAVDYVSAQCKDFGLQVYKQTVKVNKGTCVNTIAVLPGGKQRIVIGAHLDAVDGRRRDVYNGADDNASGCAIVLALAKRLRGCELGPTLEFHFYTGEEEGLKGSKNYVKAPLVGLDQYRFMLNLDMVGRLQKRGAEAFKYADLFAALAEKYPFATKITYCEDTGDSDHSSWWKAGVPAACLHTGMHDEYHTPDDDANKIDYKGMEDILDYAESIVRGVASKIKPSDYNLH